MAKKKNRGKVPPMRNPPPPPRKTPARADANLRLTPINRALQTLATWKTAGQQAESIAQPVRQALYDLYDSIVLDDQVVSVIAKRRLALSRATLQFTREGEPDEVITPLLQRMAFRRQLQHMLDARLWGYTLVFSHLAADQVELIPRRHVVPTKHLVVASPYDQRGIDYTQPPFSAYHLAVGDPLDLGLLFPVAYCVLLKRNDIVDWAAFNEIFGQPFRTATYDTYDPTQKAQLDTMMEQMGSRAWATLPNGSTFQLHDTNRTGARDTFESFAARQDRAISKIVLGQTMTTDAEGGNYKGEVHERVSDDIAEDDLKYVMAYLNEQFLPMLAAQGYPVEGGTFMYVEEEVVLSKKERLAMDIDIHTKVAPLETSYFETEYNVPIDQVALAERKAQREAATDDDPDDGQHRDTDAQQRDKKARHASPTGELPPASLWQSMMDFFQKAPSRW